MKAFDLPRRNEREVAKKHCPARIFFMLLSLKKRFKLAYKMTCAKNSSSFFTFLI
jgi:hypothetical protein